MSRDPWRTDTSERHYFAHAHRDNICPQAQLVKMKDKGLRWHALQSGIHLLHRGRFV
jgi:hypothetical protein